MQQQAEMPKRAAKTNGRVLESLASIRRRMARLCVLERCLERRTGRLRTGGDEDGAGDCGSESYSLRRFGFFVKFGGLASGCPIDYQGGARLQPVKRVGWKS